MLDADKITRVWQSTQVTEVRLVLALHKHAAVGNLKQPVLLYHPSTESTWIPIDRLRISRQTQTLQQSLKYPAPLSDPDLHL